MRIAVIGSGISGLTAARLLSREHEVDVYEQDSRIGGHTHTHDIVEDGRRLSIDTGFIVFNRRTYPHFCRLLELVGVESRDSNMSFSVRDEQSGLEYNGTNLDTLFAQRKNLLSPSFLGMLADIARFNRAARKLSAGPESAESLGEFLARGRFGRAFREHYLIPMGSAVWSAAPSRMLEFPAWTFARFFDNHGFLDLGDRPQWRVVSGGSRSYLEPLAEPFARRIHRKAPVVSLARRDAQVFVRTAQGLPRSYDHAVVAVHSDQALALLEDPSDAEREVLGAIEYQENEAVLHTDARLLPRLPKARAAWNYHVRSPEETHGPGGSRVAVSYWMNSLQSLTAREQYLVTLNRTASIDPSRILARMTYHHPVYTLAGLAAQKRKREISGVRRTHYCGAYWGFGFHEDGVVSALDVAASFGQSLEGVPPRERSAEARSRGLAR
ncbi:MAG: FAD-dependent oxidoreductase [Planctomycetes bacterium]|nr:FAD-dependent oxidoreductase [Planctomycetota bacterium]